VLLDSSVERSWKNVLKDKVVFRGMKFRCKLCDKVIRASSEKELIDHLEAKGVFTPNLRNYYYVEHTTIEEVIDFIYNTLYQGYPTKIKEEASRLMKSLGKPRLGVAVVALYVASEKIACPLDMRKAHRYAKMWRVPFWKFLEIFRKMHPRKDVQYYLQCTFNEFARKLKRYHETEEAWCLSQGLREELRRNEGILAKLYETTFQILLSLPRKLLIKSPRSLIAGVVYIAGVLEGIHLTQRDIAVVLDITDVTVRNRYWEVRDVLLNNLEKLPSELRTRLERARIWLE